MDILHGVLAAVAGAALGWVQFKLLQWTLAKGKAWLIAVKLPLWVLGMIAAYFVSLSALIGLVAGATASFVWFGVAHWRALRKGE